MRRVDLWATGAKSKREDGIRDIGSRLQLSGDRYRLYIHRRCVNLTSELQSYDPSKKERDHAVDALRYALSEVGRSSGELVVSTARRPR